MFNDPDTSKMASPPAVTSGLKRYRGRWTAEEAKHLLKRTTFGARKADIDLLVGQSPASALNLLLDTPEPEPEPPVNDYNDDQYTDPDVPPGTTWINQLKYNGTSNGRRKNSYKAWWIRLMIGQACTLREKMVLFWHNHFVTETRTVDHAVLCYRNNALLRKHALGNFRQMVSAITQDGAMLKYLNGTANTKKAADENYGRELQELFTVGKGPGSHYTEDDVKAAARVLTGFYIDYKTLTSSFGPARHDETEKTFSAFYKHTTIAGRKGKEGAQEMEDLLDMLFEQEEISRFICRKLYRFFVYHAIDGQTEKNIIEPLAKTFRKHNYEIKPVLKQLLQSRHFFDTGNRGGIIKSPVDYTVGLCREFSIQFPPATDTASLYNLGLQLQQQTANMQQNIGDPPNVAGWPAYYQEPMYDKSWINSDTLPKRNQFTDRMIYNGFTTKDKVKILIDPLAFASQLSNPANPDALINESVQRLYMMDLPQKDKDYLKTGVLLSGLQGKMSDHYWTQAWQNLLAKPEDEANVKNITGKLKSLYKYLMNLPQYQLC